MEGATAYNLFIASPSVHLSSIEKVLLDTIITETSFSTILEPGQYQWKVIAINDISESNPVYRDFYIDSITVPVVIPITPMNNKLLNTDTIEFVWNGNSGDQFIFSLNYEDELVYTVVTESMTLKLPEATNSTFVLNEGNYEWQIQARGDYGAVSPLESRSFVVDTTSPEKPILTPSHWSLTSGGLSESCVPSAVDNVIFDANSFTLPDQVVEVDIPSAYCHDMTWVGVSNLPSFSSSSTSNTLKVYGSLEYDANMLIPFNGVISFEGSTLGNTITTSNQLLSSSIEFNGPGGGWGLTDSLKNMRRISLNAGSVQSNDNYIECSDFSSSVSSDRSLYLGESFVKVTGSWIVSNSLALDADSSVLYLCDSYFEMYRLGGLEYGEVEIFNVENPDIYDSNNKIRKLVCNSVYSENDALDIGDYQVIDTILVPSFEVEIGVGDEGVEPHINTNIRFHTNKYKELTFTNIRLA